MLMWKPHYLPLECSPQPFSVALYQTPVLLNPCWVVLDRDGIAVALVARASDATRIAKLLNRPRGRRRGRPSRARIHGEG
jgi:hypothetical protein